MPVWLAVSMGSHNNTSGIENPQTRKPVTTVRSQLTVRNIFLSKSSTQNIVPTTTQETS